MTSVGGVMVVGAELETLAPHEGIITIHVIYAEEMFGLTFTRPSYMRTGQERTRGERGRFISK